MDIQAEFERGIMSLKSYNDNWFVSDDDIDEISEREYRMYEAGCVEYETEVSLLDAE